MNFSESFRQAFDSLRSNKLRSILTMLGIIMGVFSVITIVAIGNAAQGYIDAQFEKIGANIISITYNYKNRNPGENDWLKYEDMDTIRRIAPEIKNIATMIQMNGSFRLGSKSKDAFVYGVSSQYKSFSPIEMSEGRFISDIDVSAKSNVVVVDERFAKKYFKKVDIVGEILQFKTGWGSTTKLKVIGVIKSEDDLFGSLMDNDYAPTFVYCPISTVQSMRFGYKRLDSIMISVVGKDKLKEIGDRIVKTLELQHGKTEIYMAQNSADQQKAFSNVTNVISSALLVIAIITLIVGGIGIINILLVSVTERIREIGIRKALGAQKRDIIIQFITESIIMTGISGLIGIFLGVLAGNIIARLIKIPPTVNIPVVICSFLGSIALGLIFGVYPAKKAADLDPIESLRYE